MLTAYFDAAGHESDQEFVVVAGFISSVGHWREFDKLWKVRLERDGIEYFHMVEFAQSTGQFKGWRGDEARRKALLGDLMRLIRSHAYRKFVSVVEIQALNENMSEAIKEQYHIRAYSLAGRSCAARVREWLQQERWQTDLELVFEDGDIGKGDLEKRLITDGFAQPLFRPKKETVNKQGKMIEGLTPLQAADFLAYEVFLATKRISEDRWAMKEFAQMVGPMGLYQVKDIKQLDESLAKLDEMVLKLD